MDLESDLCSGCHRTIEEIAAWSRMDNDAKRVVWARIESRTAPGAGA
jgi:predicted Fe-S protein YdhL (DUF1289 family)